MLELKADGEVAEAERMQWSLDDTISEVVYVMDRNLNVLNSQLSTDYGNVESRRIKSRQNQFYDREKPANHPSVLSTTQRCFPCLSLLSMPRLAMRLDMPRCLRWARQRL